MRPVEEGLVDSLCTLLSGGIRRRVALLALQLLPSSLSGTSPVDFEFRDIQKPTDKVSFDVARLRVYRKSEVIVS